MKNAAYSVGVEAIAMAYFGYDHFQNSDGIEAATQTKERLVDSIEALIKDRPFDVIALDRAMGFIEIFRVICEHCSSPPPDNMTGASVQRWRRAIMEWVEHAAEHAHDAENAEAIAKRREAIEVTFAKLQVFEKGWRESRHWHLMLLPTAGPVLQADPNAVIRCPSCDEADLDVQRTTSDGNVECLLRCPRCGLAATLSWADDAAS